MSSPHPLRGEIGAERRWRYEVGAEETGAVCDSLVAMIEDGDPRRLIDFVAGCPPDGQCDETLELLRRPDLEFRLMGLNMLALCYSRTEHAATGLEISDTADIALRPAGQAARDRTRGGAGRPCDRPTPEPRRPVGLGFSPG
jgi:hypothetical protein